MRIALFVVVLTVLAGVSIELRRRQLQERRPRLPDAVALAVIALALTGALLAARCLSDIGVVVWEYGWAGYFRDGIRATEVVRHRVVFSDGRVTGADVHSKWTSLWLIGALCGAGIVGWGALWSVSKISPQTHQQVRQLFSNMRQ